MVKSEPVVVKLPPKLISPLSVISFPLLRALIEISLPVVINEPDVVILPPNVIERELLPAFIVKSLPVKAKSPLRARVLSYLLY